MIIRKQDLIDIIATKAQTTEKTAKAFFEGIHRSGNGSDVKGR